MTTAIHSINTFMATKDGETHLVGQNEHGEDIQVVFKTIELLEWLDIDHMKEKEIERIKAL